MDSLVRSPLILTEQDQCPLCWDPRYPPDYENRFGVLVHRHCQEVEDNDDPRWADA